MAPIVDPHARKREARGEVREQCRRRAGEHATVAARSSRTARCRKSNMASLMLAAVPAGGHAKA